jgi:hypothetical protein
MLHGNLMLKYNATTGQQYLRILTGRSAYIRDLVMHVAVCSILRSPVPAFVQLASMNEARIDYV